MMSHQMIGAYVKAIGASDKMVSKVKEYLDASI